MPENAGWSVPARCRSESPAVAALSHDSIQHSRHSSAGKLVSLRASDIPVYSITTLSTRIARPHSTASCTKSAPILIAESRQQRLSLTHAMLRSCAGSSARLAIDRCSLLWSPVLVRRKHVQPPIPEARLRPRQLHQLRAQRFIAAASGSSNSLPRSHQPQTRRWLAATCSAASPRRPRSTSSTRFCDHRLQHLLVQAQIHHQLLQSRVSSRNCLPLAPRYLHPTYLAFQA